MQWVFVSFFFFKEVNKYNSIEIKTFLSKMQIYLFKCRCRAKLNYRYLYLKYRLDIYISYRDTCSCNFNTDIYIISNRDLDKLEKWETSWLMAFHPEKCNVLTITKKRNPIKFNYILHGHSLEHVTSAKYLGCTITSDLKWGPHINNICNKANSTIGFLKRNLNIVNKSVKERA